VQSPAGGSVRSSFPSVKPDTISDFRFPRFPILIRPGEIVFGVYCRESSNEPNRLVADRYGLPAALNAIAIFPLLAATICFLVVKPAARAAK